MASQLKTVEKVLQEADEARARNIAQRLNACMAEVDYIQKEKKQGMNYSIVSHDAVTAKVRPILQAHGVVYYPRDFQSAQNGNRTELVFTVRFENIDDRTDYIDVATMGYGVDAQDKGPGKAISYGVKYALLKVLGLETGDDPDEVQDNRADHRITTDEPKSRKDAPKLTGPYDTVPKLEKAAKEFVRTLRGMGSLAEFDEWAADKDVQAFVDQCKRDLSDWWEGGPSIPAEMVPLGIEVRDTRRGLKQIAEMENQ